MEADFGGYATKANVKCSDGKTIASKAFAHMDKERVPLVYNHGHNNPENVLGHALLEHRDDGVYAYGYFNNTKQGQDAKEYVQHKDIKAMSIYANRLVMQGQTVMHGQIKEVSLVLAGANPEATIDYVQHKDDDGDIVTRDDAAFIHNGYNIDESSLSHAAKTPSMPDKKNPDGSDDDTEGPDAEDGTGADETIQDVYDTLTEKQKNVVNYMIGVAVANNPDDSAQHADGEDEYEDDADDYETDDETDDADNEGDLNHKEGTGTVTNVFEQANQQGGAEVVRHSLDKPALRQIYQAAKRSGSLMDALDEYALAHGINNVEALFPNPKLLESAPDFNSRNMAWVQNVLDGTRNTPFAAIKSIVADITQDEARAKGYITGNYKKEEWFGLVSRTTTPTTIYKKQQLDRDTVLDVIDFDMVAWLKGEMRIMLSEEIAVAILLGDGREVDDPDHVADPMGGSSGPGVRSILNDDELYVTRVAVNIDDAGSDPTEIVDAIMMASEFYKGTGSPTFYTTQRTLNTLLLSKDLNGRRNFDNPAALAAAMNVKDIVAVEPLLRFPNVVGIVVNLIDYNIGTDRGGEVNMFDFFDIDYNKLKYLMETRLSGALVKLKSAMVITRTTSTNVLVTPQTPGWVQSTGVVTIPTQAGVVYKSGSRTGSTITGAQAALATGASLQVFAVPASGYYFAVTGTNLVDEWTFKRPSA